MLEPETGRTLSSASGSDQYYWILIATAVAVCFAAGSYICSSPWSGFIVAMQIFWGTYIIMFFFIATLGPLFSLLSGEYRGLGLLETWRRLFVRCAGLFWFAMAGERRRRTVRLLALSLAFGSLSYFLFTEYEPNKCRDFGHSALPMSDITAFAFLAPMSDDLTTLTIR